MTTAIPTLSSIGWVTTIEEKGDYLLSWFLTSEYSQSVLYHGRVASLQYLIKAHANDPSNLEADIESTLRQVFTAAFGDDTKVSVSVVEHDPEQEPGKLTIQLNCMIREDGLDYSLGRRVESLNGKLTKISNINNG